MDIVRDEGAKLCAVNNKKAYFAMCRATILLFVFVVFSKIVEMGIMFLFVDNPLIVEGAVAKCFEFFGMSAGSAILEAKNFVHSVAVGEFISGTATMFTLVLPTTIFAKTVKLSPDECFPVKGKILGSTVFMFAICITLTITGSVFSSVINDFIFPDQAAAHVSSAVAQGMQYDIYAMVLNLLYVAVMVPLAEEFVFRGVILTYLRQYGLTFAVIASSCLFGIAHSSPTQSVYAFIFGLIVAFVTIVTGNIKTAVILHSANNAVTSLSEFLPVVIGEEKFGVYYSIYVTCVSLLAFIGVYIIVVKDRLFDVYEQKANENDGGISVKPGLAQVITLPLVFYVLYYAGNYVTEVLG